jgi:hypothetical protein
MTKRSLTRSLARVLVCPRDIDTRYTSRCRARMQGPRLWMRYARVAGRSNQRVVAPADARRPQCRPISRRKSLSLQKASFDELHDRGTVRPAEPHGKRSKELRTRETILDTRRSGASRASRRG